MRLLANLSAIWVYEDENAPVYDPPGMTMYQGKYYVHPSATDAFYRWEAAQRPVTLKYDTYFSFEPMSEHAIKRKRLRDAVVKLADELCGPQMLFKPGEKQLARPKRSRIRKTPHEPWRSLPALRQ